MLKGFEAFGDKDFCHQGGSGNVVCRVMTEVTVVITQDLNTDNPIYQLP